MSDVSHPAAARFPRFVAALLARGTSMKTIAASTGYTHMMISRLLRHGPAENIQRFVVMEDLTAALQADLRSPNEDTTADLPVTEE